MQIDLITRQTLVTPEAPTTLAAVDPLDRDAASDEIVVTTTRSLIRLVLVAAETASRFEREAIGHDPVAWMLAPRDLFAGRSAVEACLSREECLRAVLLHGLSIGLDADPMTLDALMAEDDDVDADRFDEADVADGSGTDLDAADRANGAEQETLRLWTSFLIAERGTGTIQAFDAVVAGDRLEAETKLRARHGAAVGDAIEVSEGFDPSSPMAEALLSPAVADMLEQVAADPYSPLAKGLSVSFEQRFAA
ncbi:hypothetical protein [Sphingomonas sp. PP-CC-3G-468]|uniref:hypothetical protein n=1 Tax=Sphingomonas sp. PP-CC-3G-468 TaxID=2135656 RepID=UPI0010EA7021|nr:hypothetical protein [Sphingomonas sp. PP-CC-3G-468]TCM07368.1 hypothetical protein C8J41_103276 [Sphingomonas sp. PP-CC-3G-468]